MVDDVTINRLRENEIYPGLDNLIHDVKCKFGINEKLDVYIVDDTSSGPNMYLKSKFGLNKDPNTLNISLNISRGMFKTINMIEKTDEMKSLIAHEVSHLKNEDVYVSNNFIPIYAALAILFATVVAFLSTCNPILISITLIIIAIWGIRNYNWKQRKMEKRADTDAVIEMGNPNALQTALKKIYIAKKDNPNNQRFAALYSVYDFVVGSSHPSTTERINNIEMWKPPR